MFVAENVRRIENLPSNVELSYQRCCAADWRVANWDDTLHYDVCCCSSLAISASHSFLARLGCSQTVRHHSGKGERCSLFMLSHLERARAVGCCYAPFSSFLIHPLSLKAPRVKWNKWWKSWTILDRICECTNSPRSENSLRCGPKTIFATPPWWLFLIYLVQYSLNDFCEVWFLLKYPKYQRF